MSDAYLPKQSVDDRELRKFKADPNGDVAVNVVGEVELGPDSLEALENITVTVENEVEVKNDVGNPVPISAASLPLPTGAATLAEQQAQTTKLNDIYTALTTGDQQGYGTTTQFAGTVGLSSTAFPSVAGDFISTILIRCPEQTPVTNRLSYSFDNVTFHVLAPGEFIAWSLKGNKTQVYLKGNVAAVSYELTLNREPA